VFIGPEKTNQVSFSPGGRPVTGTVPEILEKGGRVTVFEVARGDGWQRADLRSRRRLTGKRTRLRTSTVAGRPYMSPAFEKERAKLPSLWERSIV
jgi:hypothetical protein